MTIIDIPWQQPVSVQLQNGSTRLFRGAYDALDFLENEWPIRKGHHYENTISLCRSALARAISTEVAREAFLASCLEAGLAWNMAPQLPPNAAGRSSHVSV